MAIGLDNKEHTIQTQSFTIHEHMNVVRAELLQTEKSFIERGYVITWQGVSTYWGTPGTTQGFTTRLVYSLEFRPDTPKADKEVIGLVPSSPLGTKYPADKPSEELEKQREAL